MKIINILVYIFSLDRYAKKLLFLGFFASALEVASGVLIAWTLGSTISFLISAGTASTDVGFTIFSYSVIFSFSTIISLGAISLLVSTCLNGYIQLKLNEFSAGIGALFAHSIIVSWLADVPHDLENHQLNDSEIQKKAISDSQRLTVAVVQPLMTAMPKVFLIVLSILAIVVIFPESLVFLFLVGVILAFPLVALRRLIRRNGNQLTSYDLKRFEALKTTIDLADEIMVYGLQDQLLSRLKERLDSFAATYGRGVGFSSLPRYIVEFIVFGVALAGAAFVVFNTTSLTNSDASKMALVLVIFLKVIPAIQIVLTSLARVNGSSQLFFDLITETSVKQSAVNHLPKKAVKTTTSPILDIESVRIEKLSVSFVTTKIIYPDFTVRKNEITLVKGRSGSGKTTLVRAILGLVKSSGSIEFGFFLDKNYSQIGYCSQTPPIFSGSISSNLFLDSGIPSNLDKELIVAIEKMLMLPLQHQVTEGGRNVSGGQRVRIGIARAIFSARPVLIFDEPTNGQDADTVQRIIDMLDIVKLDRIIIVVSHDPRLISIADNLIDLDR